MLMRVEEMIMYMGDPGRLLMYGSDWPLVGMGPYIKFLGNLDLTEEQLGDIPRRTAARLFRIEGLPGVSA
jgi:predicted TIM-barrel fold metal-dependent hydrolase